MATLKYGDDAINQSTTNPAGEKLSSFDQPASASVVPGQKTQFTDIPAFYVGGGIKAHFPYAKDENGRKIPKKDNSARNTKRDYVEYERASTSDGWQFTLHTPGKDPLYVVTREKPDLEVGSYYLVSGLGYGRGQYPTYLDEAITLEEAGSLTLYDANKVVLKEN